MCVAHVDATPSTLILKPVKHWSLKQPLPHTSHFADIGRVYPMMLKHCLHTIITNNNID